MPYREKIIKEYERFVDSYISLCTSHDYEYEMHKAVLALLKEQEQMYYTLEHDWRMCRELLKEQETNPIEPVEETANDVLLWHCGKCGFYLGPNDHFCSNCGRAVKWK